MTNWFYASIGDDLDNKQLILAEMVNTMDVPSSLTEALSLVLNPRSDWMMRVYAFNFLRQPLSERGPKGIQEVAQNFEKVMRLVSRYLDDLLRKVAQSALSSLAEIMPFFRKPFEHYLDKMLPHVFSWLNDPKESIKQLVSNVRADDMFSSAFQCLPNIPLEVHECRTGKIGSESINESYGHNAEMMDQKSSMTRLSSGIPRRSNYSVLSESTVESPSKDVMMNDRQDHSPSISQAYHQHAASQMDKVHETSGHLVSIKNLHQMSSSLLEMLDDPDESTRELALSLLVEILEKQGKAMENCIETLVVKLLHATKDAVLKVVNQAHICLTTVVSQFDPLRCLGALASQLVCHDEKILIVSINSLSKLVICLSQDDFMTHLSTFLPALLDTFENHSTYVRKAIVLCLVDIYLKLGPAFLPYLERLDSAQLQLARNHTRQQAVPEQIYCGGRLIDAGTGRTNKVPMFQGQGKAGGSTTTTV